MSPTIFQREGQVHSNGAERWTRHESGLALGVAGVGEVESSGVRGIGGRGTALSKIAAGRVASEHAKGETMFGADGTSVPTRNADGTKQWREMKMGVLVKRERGASALPEDWDKRTLPKPTAVSAFAMIAVQEKFQERCQCERRRLGVGSVTTTVGDGAKRF